MSCFLSLVFSRFFYFYFYFYFFFFFFFFFFFLLLLLLYLYLYLYRYLYNISSSSSWPAIKRKKTSPDSSPSSSPYSKDKCNKSNQHNNQDNYHQNNQDNNNNNNNNKPVMDPSANLPPDVQQRLRRPNIWTTSAFQSLLVDPFLHNNSQIEPADLPSCAAVLNYLFQNAPNMAPWAQDVGFIECLQELKERSETAAKADDASKFTAYVDKLLHRMQNMQQGQVIMIPGGWQGTTTQATLVYIVERVAFPIATTSSLSQPQFSFTIVNAGGAGIQYHPSVVASDAQSKIKYLTCFTLCHVSQEKILDRALWATLVVQHVKKSEFHRAEVIYDVLLPALLGQHHHDQPVATIAASFHDATEIYRNNPIFWRTPHRAASSSAWRSLLEAIRYFLHKYRAQSHLQIKQFTTLLKCEMLALANADLSDENRLPPTDDEIVILRLACNTVAHAVLKQKIYANQQQLEQITNLIQNINHRLDTLDEFRLRFKQPQRQQQTDPSPNSQQQQQQLQPPPPLFDINSAADLGPLDVSDLKQQNSTWPNLTLNNHDVENYAGVAQEPSSLPIADLLHVPHHPVQNIQEAVAALVKLELVCNQLNQKSSDGSSFSSRIALQLQIVHLIAHVFTNILPMPKIDSDSPASSPPTGLWVQFPTRDLQLTCLKLFHRIALLYAQAWQSFDNPTRAFDSERALVIFAIFIVFDATLRYNQLGLTLSALILEDGGYAVSTSLCVANLPVYKIASTLEVHHPHYAIIRHQILAYLHHLHYQCRYYDLFSFRMPTDMIEIKKYSTTILFLRKIMERSGYELVPRDNPQPPPEIESLLEWLTSTSTPLARQQPEFGMYRDMACLLKFLSTMETRQSELQRQRIPASEYVSWNLSFEDHSSQNTHFIFRRQFSISLRWEVMNYRGADLDTADVQVTSFGDRKIFFGEGSVVHSPADVHSLLNRSASYPLTEDDILHSEVLPNFGDTLSRQESEVLLSYLTVPYMRIPLVLAFFAAADRVTYLFNYELQTLLRSVVFEASYWVPEQEDEKITTVPLLRNLPDSANTSNSSSIQKAIAVQLGSPMGQLLNELQKAPEATLNPLLKMLKSLNDLAEASVYSPDAALCLYLIELAVDVQSYFKHANIPKAYTQNFHHILTKTATTILKKWLCEAMATDDVETSCTIHSYLAIVFMNVQPESYDVESVSQMIGSICFVRNWHNFGLVEESKYQAETSSAYLSIPPENRLMRFMQAHGVNTARIVKGSLQKYLASDRALYLRVGPRTFRVPNFNDKGENAKSKLYANVLENKLYSLLQLHRAPLISFLEQLHQDKNALTLVLNAVSKIALNTHDTKSVLLFEDKQINDALMHETINGNSWTLKDTKGHYLSPDQELTIDVQSAQIMWRNDELKPLPDTMTQFNDFYVIFGKQQLHCGLVTNQQHRQWVHIVGTEYDLILWDEPDDNDQGVGAPQESVMSRPVGTIPHSMNARNDDDDDDKTESTSWSCASCTVYNAPEASTCAVCGMTRPSVSSNASGPTWACAQCTFKNQNAVQACMVCSTQRPRVAPSASSSEQVRPGGSDGDAKDKNSPDVILYQGKRYDRHVNPFKEGVDRDFKEDELWILKLLSPIVKAHYREEMDHKILLPSGDDLGQFKIVSAMACVKTEREVEEVANTSRIAQFLGPARMKKVIVSTWKQYFFLKDRHLVLVFNFVSHGRKMFKQLIFSSNFKYSLHTLDISKKIYGACGDITALVLPDPSLVITRTRNGLTETFIPARLLSGVVPGALLEAYQFWFGTDDLLRGEPLDAESQWFGNRIIEISLDGIILQKPFQQRQKTINLFTDRGTKRRLVVHTYNPKEEQKGKMKLDENSVVELSALGFSPAAARLALSKSAGNPAFAAEWLLNPENQVQISFADSLVPVDATFSVCHHGEVNVYSMPVEDKVHRYKIFSLGFGQTVHVIERAGNWLRISDTEKTEAWVLESHPELGTLMEPLSHPKDGGQTSNEVSSAAKKALEKLGNWDPDESMKLSETDKIKDILQVSARKLINLVETPPCYDPVYRLLTVLTNVENVSHVLIWGNKDTHEVETIEIPRLKLKLEPEYGILKFLDHAGWFLVKEVPKKLMTLLDGDYLLLMNDRRELQFLVPNHELTRPTLTGRPFSTAILGDRGSFSWLQTMDTRYFLYSIHTSLNFLMSQELSASLYLVLLKFLKRNYKDTFRLAYNCTVDVPLNPDEGYIWNQLERAGDDCHPDAHACRLKLTLATKYVKDHIHMPWEIHEEYDQYLAKLPRVSVYCRLTRKEEKDICVLVSVATPLIKNRLLSLNHDQKALIDLKGPVPRVGGSPWSKLQSNDLNYFDNNGTLLKRIQYRTQLEDATNVDDFLMDVIFSGHLISDEESGANRQLGFTFLSQLILGIQPVNSKMNLRFTGSLLSCYLHLKLSRWGRETISEGEVEASNSRHMAQLAAMARCPTATWPPLPLDPHSKDNLQRGVNLFTAAGRQSTIKMWTEQIDTVFRTVWDDICQRERLVTRTLSPQEYYNLINAIEHNIQPAVITSTDCSSRITDIKENILKPFQAISSRFVTYAKSTNPEPYSSLPFDLKNHPSAQNLKSKEILQRLEEDVRSFHNTNTGKLEPNLKSLDLENLSDLISQLDECIVSDGDRIHEGILSIEKQISRIQEENFELRLRRFAQHVDTIDFNLTTQASMAVDGSKLLAEVNPDVSEESFEQVIKKTLEIVVLTNRISHGNRCIALTKNLKALKELKNPSSQDLSRMHQLSKTLAESLDTKRYFICPNGSFDPRFLIFEYVFDILLRERQVDIVNAFVKDMQTGQSHVQQMLMGAGKTTVVAPLLTLLLADGEVLVTQVMPTALLEQTRHVLRTRFSAVITKRVYTLEFDRSCEDSPDFAHLIFNKLEEARTTRSVVCTSPDAIKSLFLKFIEHAHSIESVDPAVLNPSTSLRQNKEIVSLRDIMQNRSEMADLLVPIFNIWQQGVLVLDEVDVLLHPLKSELNFPIGAKDPIDMSGFRWDLPMHLLRAFFPGTIKQELQPGRKEILSNINGIIEKGFKQHTLQHNPHLVLLDESFYHEEFLNPIAQWCYQWISTNTNDIPEETMVIEYLTAPDLAKIADKFCNTKPGTMKILNLSRDWIRIFLPHVISKIDRVSFGILNALDLSNIDHNLTPLSRKLLAVPFVGKDVPSRSSEFAHPDVVIGLTILGYRYEGLRLSDVRKLVTQLKADFSRQIGPRDQRPATRLFRHWLLHACKSSDDKLPVLPLPLFQVNDMKQLKVLFNLLKKQEEVITYYLRQHVFPACMNFQSIKISACGHELGSSILFKKRIGFSGTPSNLLPNDLGQCMYEPGSDGLVINVLSSPDVVSIVRKDTWTAKSLLEDVAASNPPVHALIDTGALITGLDNEEVAHFLLEKLPADKFEGVVYLDRADRKMILQRSSGRSLHLSQCGINPSKRFTFYDQVHCTGMDIFQAPNAVAVVTLGKDMTFRDYAQGTFRMRGIGNGQAVKVYLIPEVEHLIQNELFFAIKAYPTEERECTSIDIMAWLLINSMKMESCQFSMLSLQELYNCWRKRALHFIVDDCEKNSPILNSKAVGSRMDRVRRFSRDDNRWLKTCIELFREPVGFTVPDKIPLLHSFQQKVGDLVEMNRHFVQDDNASSLISDVTQRIRYSKNIYNVSLETEIVNENEQEQQEEQEEEAEEEQEKISRFVRDDEQANPWDIFHLNKPPSCLVGDEPFYRMNMFRVRPSQPCLSFPQDMLLSDNWFRPRWIGLGDRKLKNVMIIMEWCPSTFSLKAGRLIPRLNEKLVKEQKMEAQDAAFRAFQIALAPSTDEDFELHKRVSDLFIFRRRPETYYVAVSLSEAETLRRVLHTKQSVLFSDFALVELESGMIINKSANFHGGGLKERSRAISCFRFVNSDMFYTKEELETLQKTFAASSLSDRETFFEDCLRLRRREKYLWGDTPLAQLFTEQSEWHLLEPRALLQQMSQKLLRILQSKKSKLDLAFLFLKVDSDKDGSLSASDFLKLLEELHLGFSPADYSSVIHLCLNETGSKNIVWKEFLDKFRVPEKFSTKQDLGESNQDKSKERWQCSNCTYINFASDVMCDVCGYGWSGEIHVPSDKWMCDPAYGGCTFFNSENNFYCEMCNRSKPSLQTVRF